MDPTNHCHPTSKYKNHLVDLEYSGFYAIGNIHGHVHVHDQDALPFVPSTAGYLLVASASLDIWDYLDKPSSGDAILTSLALEGREAQAFGSGKGQIPLGPGTQEGHPTVGMVVYALESVKGKAVLEAGVQDPIEVNSFDGTYRPALPGDHIGPLSVAWNAMEAVRHRCFKTLWFALQVSAVTYLVCGNYQIH